jgi:hypothetical protein
LSQRQRNEQNANFSVYMFIADKILKVVSRLQASVSRAVLGDSNHQGFPWVAGSILYIVSFGMQFRFLNAMYWDDWLIYADKSGSETSEWFSSSGFGPLHGLIQVTILNKNPQLIHLISFILFFFAALLVFRILKTVPELQNEQARVVTLFFLVLPINSARVSLMVFNYTYSLFFFLTAWYLLVSYRKNWLRFIAGVLFVLSFSTLSLLPFYFVPLAHLWISERQKSNLRRASATTFVFAILAPLYWIAERTWLKPDTESRLDYLTPTFSGTARAGVLVIFTFLGAVLAVRSYLKNPVRGNQSPLTWIGLFVTGCGAFAYMTSGRLVDLSEWMLNFVPRASDWNSRHQLLLGFGLSLFIVGMLGSLRSTFKIFVIAVSLICCLVLNVAFMQGYYLDALKQSETVVAFEASEEIRDAHVVMIDDQSELLNARGRNIRTYEWESMLSSAFGDSGRKVVYSTYVDCSGAAAEIPDTRVSILFKKGRFMATISGHVGIRLIVESIDPCD